MNSLLVTLGISLTIINCKAAIFDYSNITPWRVAYAVYPVYNSEPWIDVWRNQQPPQSWIEVWKNERSWDVFNNAVNLKFGDDHKNENNLNTKVAGLNNLLQNSQQPVKSVENKNLKSKKSLNYSWPRNDKDWSKNVKKDHASI
ncbi:uncharacterized protein LOC131667419 [Phymastichus coffea]|uniref:uncharacterized protein LOC131667419 n=1 Tax=Phymastichus coffea TaxID=108790 RepID=UPI00273CB443|nr:uncharacterized protein LOC131667419 [Phymastichus coffea]